MKFQKRISKDLRKFLENFTLNLGGGKSVENLRISKLISRTFEYKNLRIIKSKTSNHRKD